MKMPAAEKAVYKDLRKFGAESGESQKEIWSDRWSKK